MREVPDLVFTGVRVAGLHDAYVSSTIQQLNADRFEHAVIHHYRDGAVATSSSLAHARAGMVVTGNLTQPDLLVVGIDGEVFEVPWEGLEEDYEESQGEHVDRSDVGPSSLLHLRAVERIGDTIYCAGFGRHVYARAAGRQWRAIDGGVFVPRERRGSPVGFFAITGYGENELYAAGLGGEIWSRTDGRWSQEASPTNVSLNTAVALGGGSVCIAGMLGVVLIGRSNRWRVVDHSRTKQPFWGATKFRERVYLANNNGVFVLNDTLDDLELVYQGSRLGAATSYLDASEACMWSVGEKVIAKTEDGRSWHELPLPV